MSSNYMRLICLVACVAVCAASGYGGRGGYSDIVKPQDTAEAQAAALTNAAGAAAAAAKLDGADWYALNRYGWEQGRPLLARPYGPLDPLYAAALPPRSFVAEIDPVFKKNKYGAYGQNIVTLNTESKLSATAI
ncbi:chorion protein S16 [Scaptodrosophila lebanonensis]|uniref:Chorion protein S16 n=1 Tax=Drosophila lebanonensis TaxID=7225 RepID=A0A6J2TBT0_DROLE|nr:chorion protein S16 [Scaptodrosophila lebanonensis]